MLSVAEVQLPASYNFYHDPLPEESRLVFEPVLKLMTRIAFILSQGWESPILNDALFLCNYLMTECKPDATPLMKLLTGIELILNKLEEWEVYAAKSLNSCESEALLLKQLVIRLRKVQILSWRNLLRWKQLASVSKDCQENFVRLAHALEKHALAQ